MRYVIEGEWTGYTRAQTRVVHRRVTTRKAVAEWAAKTRSIQFTDGTSLHLSVRVAAPREKVKEIRGYDELLYNCRMEGVDTVNALMERRKAKEAARDTARAQS